MKHKLDKYFRQKLDTPQQPPEEAWNYISNNLPKEKEKKRIFPFWMRISGIAASLCFMMGIGYWLGTESNQKLEAPGYVTNPEANNSGNDLPQQESNSTNQVDNESEVPDYLSHDQNVLTNPHSETSFIRNNTYSYNNSSQPYNYQFTNHNNTLENVPQREAVNVLGFEDSVYRHNNSSWDNLNLDPAISLNLPEFKDAQLDKNNEVFFAINKAKKEEKEKKKKKHVDFDRFHISAFASPLAFNTFVGNSMLADEMSEYRTDNNVTLAYGVKAAYSITPRLKVRTGVSVVGLEQITHDVPLAVDISGGADLSTVDRINNINYLGEIRIDNHSMATSLAEMEMSSRTGYGDMQQQTSYIEIPLEAELSLFQTNSIGISATGGGSTWLLSKNKIYVHTDDYTEELGKANNLNNVTFSANAGLKFDMNLTEDVKLNVEPNFRYLFNPVSNIEKYNPYTVGVNAGISISLK